MAEVNHFDLFGVKPRPWLEPELLKERFLAFSAELHPDKELDPSSKARAEQRFAALNEAYNVLRQSRTRILHLASMAGVPVQGHVQTVPEDLIVLFAPIAELTKTADELVRQRQAASSPMLKVQLFEKGLEITDKLQELQGQLAERIRRVESEIQDLDRSWVAGERSSIIPRLQAAASRLGFAERWQAQLQQRVAALAF